MVHPGPLLAVTYNVRHEGGVLVLAGNRQRPPLPCIVLSFIIAANPYVQPARIMPAVLTTASLLSAVAIPAALVPSVVISA